MQEFCYINHTREFIRANENIFKVGKTTQYGDARLKQYPKGTIQKIKVRVTDCTACENAIIKKFDKLFIKKTEFGREYYEGNISNMLKAFLTITKQYSVDDSDDESSKKSSSKSSSKSSNNRPNKVLLCKCCEISTKVKQAMETHKATKKHKTNLGSKSNSDVIKEVFECEKCNGTYTTLSSVTRHQKTDCTKSINTLKIENGMSKSKIAKLILTNNELESKNNELESKFNELKLQMIDLKNAHLKLLKDNNKLLKETNKKHKSNNNHQ